MKDQKRIHLTGYFDSNFGDDMMMKLVVRSLPDITFVIDKTVYTPILNEPNVITGSREECSQLQKLVVTGCGFMIENKSALKTELIRFLKKHSPGDYCLGCNIEPLKGPLKRLLISRKLNKFKLITCRDQASYKWIRKSARRPQVYCLPDILFSLPDEWLPKSKEADSLGISLMHRANDREDCDYYRAMADIADEWILKTGKNVILMAFDSGKEDDLFACHAVRSLMKYPDRTEIVSHREGGEIPQAFSRCERIIGARFHAIVLALRMNIPVFPIIFRKKVRNLLNDLQWQSPVCDLDNIDKASLYAFIAEPQVPYLLKEDITVRSNEHTRLLKQQL